MTPQSEVSPSIILKSGQNRKRTAYLHESIKMKILKKKIDFLNIFHIDGRQYAKCPAPPLENIIFVGV